MAGVHKHGFPLGTPEDEAIAVAIAAAQKQHTGDVASTEIVRTPEHEAASEYLVKVVLE